MNDFSQKNFSLLSRLRCIPLEMEKGFCDKRQRLECVCVWQNYNQVVEENVSTRLMEACLSVSAACCEAGEKSEGIHEIRCSELAIDAVLCAKCATSLELSFSYTLEHSS